MNEIGLWHAVENELPTRLLETSLKLEEHLETWLYEDPRLIAPSLLRVRRQVNLSGKKMDLLAIEEPGVWVVCEIKKTPVSRDALSQAIDYLTRMEMLTVDELEKIVLTENSNFQPGAKELIAGAHARGIHTLLVSGGFTFFTHKLQAQLSLSETHANQLEIIDGVLTGQVLGNIVDGAAKAAYVEARCLALGVNKHAAITMGDGSNDLPMMHGAGLSIAYRAKPIVKEKAVVAFDHVGLDACLDLL